jgi:hypothetical protein
MYRRFLLSLSANALVIVVSACTTPQRALTDDVFPQPLLTCASENSVPLEATEFRRSPRRYSGQCIVVRGYEISGVFFEDRSAWELFRRTGLATIGSYGSRSTNSSTDKPDHVELTALAFTCDEYNRRQAAGERREQDILSKEPVGPDEIPPVLLNLDHSFCAYYDGQASLYVFDRRVLSD